MALMLFLLVTVCVSAPIKRDEFKVRFSIKSWTERFFKGKRGNERWYRLKPENLRR